MSTVKHLILIVLVLAFSCKSQSKSTAAQEQTKVSDKKEAVEPTNEVNQEVAQPEPPKGMGQEVPQKDWPADVIAGLAKTPCFGTCPVFEFRLNQDMSAQLEANQFTEIEGNFTTTVTRAQKDELFSAMRDANFFSLDENYDGPVTDLPSTFIIFRDGGRTQKVHARFETPEELDEFIGFYQEWVYSLDWQR